MASSHIVAQRLQNIFLLLHSRYNANKKQLQGTCFVFIIATIGAIGIGIGTATESVQGQNEAGGNSCTPHPFRDPDDRGNGQSFHDCNGDFHAHQQP